MASHASGDFDGDGKSDRFELIQPAPASLGSAERAARIVFARGVSTPVQALDEGERVIGIADLDGDARDEVLIQTGGNTWTTATILTIAGCGIERVVQADGKPYWFGYAGHSNCCLGSGVGFLCPRQAKGRALIEVHYEPEIDERHGADGEAVFGALQRPDLTFEWRRRTLRLEGTRVVVVSEETGRGRANDASVPMINRFDCGGEDPR